MRGKRGEITVYFAGEIIIAVMAVLIIGNLLAQSTKAEIKVKNYISEDLALTIEAISTLPGNVLWTFHSDGSIEKHITKYEYTFKGDTALDKESNRVNVKGSTDVYPVWYPYAAREDFVIYSKVVRSDKLVFAKNNNHMMIFPNSSKIIDVFTYPTLAGFAIPRDTERDAGYIILDAGHGSKEGNIDKGYSAKDSLGKEVYEEDIVSDIALMVYRREGYIMTRDFRQGIKDYKTVEERIRIADTTGVMAVLSIHAGKHNSSDDPIIMYISSDPDTISRSKEIASRIINQILFDEKGDYNIDHMSIKIVNPEIMAKDNPMRILSVKKPAVYIEIGNMNLIDSVIFTDSRLMLANSINNALKDYGK